MSRGAVTSEGSGGEGIHHFSTIKIRATGSGELRLKVYALNNDLLSPTSGKSKILVPLPLALRNRIQPNRLVNFVEQRASFEITTVNIDEWFRLNRIVVYMKEIYTSHPGA